MAILAGGDTPEGPLADAELGQWISLSDIHGCSALLHYRLTRAQVGRSVASSVLGQLATRRREQAARNALLVEAVRSDVRSLAERTNLVLLKGAAVAALAYPHPELRPWSDVDLLVRRDEARQAEADLLALGYRRDTTEWSPHHGSPFRRRVGEALTISIDLHTELAPDTLWPVPSSEAVWRHTVATDVLGFSLLTLAPAMAAVNALLQVAKGLSCGQLNGRSAVDMRLLLAQGPGVDSGFEAVIGATSAERLFDLVSRAAAAHPSTSPSRAPALAQRWLLTALDGLVTKRASWRDRTAARAAVLMALPFHLAVARGALRLRRPARAADGLG